MSNANEVLEAARARSASAGSREFSAEVRAGIEAFAEHNRGVTARTETAGYIPARTAREFARAHGWRGHRDHFNAAIKATFGADGWGALCR